MRPSRRAWPVGAVPALGVDQVAAVAVWPAKAFPKGLGVDQVAAVAVWPAKAFPKGLGVDQVAAVAVWPAKAFPKGLGVDQVAAVAVWPLALSVRGAGVPLLVGGRGAVEVEPGCGGCRGCLAVLVAGREFGGVGGRWSVLDGDGPGGPVRGREVQYTLALKCPPSRRGLHASRCGTQPEQC